MVAAAPKVIHPAGTPGEPVIVSRVLALKPVTERKATTLAVPVGAYATNELVAPTPRVTVAVGVMANVADAVFPRLSVTAIALEPAT